MLRLPTEEADPVRRLCLAARELESLKSTTVPLLSYVLFHIIGLFPPVITGPMTSRDAGYSVGLSIFPSFEGAYYCVGKHRHLDMLFALGTGHGDTGKDIKSIGIDYNV